MHTHPFVLRAFALCLLVFGLTGRGLAQPGPRADAPHISVQLMARDSVLQPGQDSLLALRFRLEKGWHIYWQNPGDSGQAPSVAWTLRGTAASAAQAPVDLGPQLQVQPVRWPAPKRLQTGPLVNFGYEDQVVLLAPLRVASDLSVAGLSAVEVSADVHWLVCSEPCIPGHATLTLRIALAPVEAAQPRSAQAKSPEMAAIWDAAQRALPLPAPGTWQPSALLDSQAFHLRFELDASLSRQRDLRVLFIPAQPNWIDLAAEQPLERVGQALALRLARSDQLTQAPSALDGLLQLTGPEFPTQSYAVSVPVALEASTNAASSPSSPSTSPSSTSSSSSSSILKTPQLQPVPATPARPAPSSQGLGWMLILALLGGALLNLMPCVFPVLSIKALELVQIATADRRRARLQGVAYALGVLVSFWFLAGLLIVLRLMGQKLGWGFHLQSPRFLLGLSVLLFLMGLNLLGVFEVGLRLTQLGQVSADAAQRDGGGYVSAFITGVLATVVATPCTAPFMSTALGFALTQPPLVALPIFTALALGLALPYVLLTWLPVVRRLLPRPGAWMETFKQLMGFLLLGTVVWLAWILGAQVGNGGVVALLAGLLVAGVAAWLLQRWPEGRLALGISAVLILVAALAPGWMPGFDAEAGADPVSTGVAGPGRPVTTATANTAANAAAKTTDGAPPIAWEPFSKERLAEYQRQGKPVFLDFTAEWCVSCKVNERLVLQSTAVRKHLHDHGIVAMKADWTRYDEHITEALAGFGRSAIPFYALYGRDAARPPVELPAILTQRIVLDALDKLR